MRARTYCGRHTYLPDEVDMTLPLLDIWRTLGRNLVTDVSFAALGGVHHRRQEAHVQDVLAVLQQLRHWEVLREGQEKQKGET